jgi:hypothetical protein
MSIQQPETNLFSYNPDLENRQAQKVNISGKAGSCYVITEAKSNIQWKTRGQRLDRLHRDNYGYSGSSEYTIRNYKAFAPATTLQEALLHALAGFTLPLHERTAANLDDGDCIYYEFDGSLNVGFGANCGLSAHATSQTPAIPSRCWTMPLGCILPRKAHFPLQCSR